MTALYCMSYVLFLVSAFVLGHDYPLLYVLLSAFSVCCFLTLVFALCFRCLLFALDDDYLLLCVLLSSFSVCCFLTLVSALCFRQ